MKKYLVSLAASLVLASSGAGAASQDLDAAVADLVTANHILFDQGVLDAFGHVSVRDPARPDRFLLSRNMAPGLVTSGDILEFTLDGEAVNAGGRPVFLERFIHAEIFRARPDVQAVIHTHSPAVIPLSIVKTVPLRPVYHMAGFLGDGVPVFEIRDAVGDTGNMLVSDGKLAAALARTMGQRDVILLRGHGDVVAATTLKEAVFRAYYTEQNARLQSAAMALGDVTYLTPAEGASTAAAVGGQVNRAWDLWKAQSERMRQ